MPLNETLTAVATTSEHMDAVFHNCMICQKVQFRPLLSIYSGRNTVNKGLFMMRLLHTGPQKILRKKIYQEVGITSPCAGVGKMRQAFLS